MWWSAGCSYAKERVWFPWHISQFLWRFKPLSVLSTVCATQHTVVHVYSKTVQIVATRWTGENPLIEKRLLEHLHTWLELENVSHTTVQSQMSQWIFKKWQNLLIVNSFMSTKSYVFSLNIFEGAFFCKRMLPLLLYPSLLATVLHFLMTRNRITI